MSSEQVLTLSCPDRPGIVHAVSGFLAERECNILDSQQYGSARSEALTATVAGFAMTWQLDDSEHRPTVLVMVSREGHVTADLAAIGRDLECSALARAVRWHLDQRVLLDVGSTVVFP